jgi:hypothetical protein
MGMGAVLAANDPRTVQQHAVLAVTFEPHNVGSTQTVAAADQLLAAARSKFPGQNVRKIGSNGWVSGGRVGYNIILASPMSVSEINQRAALTGQIAGPRVAANVTFNRMRTEVTQGGFVTAETETAASTAETGLPTAETGPRPWYTGLPTAETPIVPLAPGPPPPPVITGEPGFFDQEVGGIPMWMLGGLGAVAITGLGLMLLWPKSSSSTANRRRARRRSRRNSRRRTRRGSRRRSRRRRLRHNWNGSVERMTMKDLARETNRMEAEGGPFTIRYGTEESSGKGYADRWEIDSSGKVRYGETKYVNGEQEARDIAGRIVMSLRRAGHDAHLGHANIR